MPSRARSLNTSGKVSFLPSLEVVKIIFWRRKSISATAYKCPENETQFRESESGSPETQFDPPAAALANRSSRLATMAAATSRHSTANPKADFFIARNSRYSRPKGAKHL